MKIWRKSLAGGECAETMCGLEFVETMTGLDSYDSSWRVMLEGIICNQVLSLLPSKDTWTSVKNLVELM